MKRELLAPLFRPLFRPLFLIVALLAMGSAAGAGRADRVTTALATPFTLGAGETARVEPEGFEVTLRTIAEDSGCVGAKDCTVMLFHGTLTMLLDPQRQLANVDLKLAAGSPASVEFAGYRVEMTDVHRAAAGAPLRVIFQVVRKPG